MKVYQAINAVQKALAAEGISKARKNAQQGYNFRGIDDVYNAVSPLLAENGLCILPRMMTRSCEERQTAKGGTLFYVTVEAEFDFVCAEDGSKHVVKTFGEAMDSGDKATNKAMSAAYKYCVMQAFAIPTEGDNDADATTHGDVRGRQPELPQSMPSDVLAEWLGAIAACKTVKGVTKALAKGAEAAGSDAKALAEMKKAAAKRTLDLAPNETAGAATAQEAA